MTAKEKEDEARANAVQYDSQKAFDLMSGKEESEKALSVRTEEKESSIELDADDLAECLEGADIEMEAEAEEDQVMEEAKAVPQQKALSESSDDIDCGGLID